MGQNRSERSTQGVEGANGEDNLRSAIHREKGSPVLSYAQEISKVISRNLPEALYRVVPSMAIDDEGSNKNVITINNLGRPSVVCGIDGTFPGIDARITDCFQKNRESAIWEGYRYGAAGEGTWKLVSLTSDGEEIWFDGRTGMVWSDLRKKDNGVNVFNWCKASGNTENDTSSEVIDCGILNDQTEQLCVDAVTPGLGDQIKWRLPTRNDYLQADLNGARFVLKKENTQGVWTATMRAGVIGRTEAWVYNSKDGTLFGGNLTSDRQVRCIGAPIR
jgi:hypothetical protein